AVPRQQKAEAGAAKPAKIGFFYIPPTDGTTAQTLASKTGFIVLTQGAETYRSQLRADGYSGKVLQYLAGNEVEGPGPYATSSASCTSPYVPMSNNVAHAVGLVCRTIHPHAR